MRRAKKDPARISPRFAVPKADSTRINYTKRTLLRLHAAWRYGVLDEQHLTQLLGSYGRVAHRELELTRAGLIYHPEVQIPLRAVCADISWITALSTRGADALAARGYRIDPTKHRERYRRHKSYYAILHDLNRSDFLVGLETEINELASRSEDPQSTIPRLQHQDQIFGQPYTETVSFSSMVVWRKEHRPITVEPDGFFSLQLSNLPADRGHKFFALEIDQNTESNTRYRSFWEQKSVLKTMISYGEAHKRGIIKDKLGLDNLRTIFVTTTQRHLQNILANAAHHYLAQGYSPNAILFVSREQLERFDALSVEYKNAAGCGVTLTEWFEQN